MNNKITVTEGALAKIKELISKEGSNCSGILVGIISGGCSGIEYFLSFAMNDNIADKFSCNVEDVNFYFNEEDEALIDGIVIDFAENSFADSFLITSNKQFSCANCSCRRGG
ncbi:MAG: hypothetical protein LBG13_01575 [Holosporales bacterium]|nr:hypothetical protein [Holosporales bacterium]